MDYKLNCPLIKDFQSNEDLKINIELDLIDNDYNFISYDEIYSLPFFDYHYNYDDNISIKYKTYKKYLVEYYYNKNKKTDKIFKLVGFMCYFNEDDYKNNKSFMYHDYINNIYNYNFNDKYSIIFILNKILVINNIIYLFDNLNLDLDLDLDYPKKIIIDISAPHIASNYNIISKIYDKYKIYINILQMINDSNFNLPEFFSEDEVYEYIFSTYFTYDSYIENLLKFID